jgi:hypothetical protein
MTGVVTAFTGTVVGTPRAGTITGVNTPVSHERYFEGTLTMGANAGTVGNRVILLKGLTPTNDGVFISLVDSQAGHSGGRSSANIHCFTTDSVGNASAAPIHIEATGTRFSNLHWYWLNSTDGYCLSATISEACAGATYRIGLLSPTAYLSVVKLDGNTLSTDTVGGTTIAVVDYPGIAGLPTGLVAEGTNTSASNQSDYAHEHSCTAVASGKLSRGIYRLYYEWGMYAIAADAGQQYAVKFKNFPNYTFERILAYGAGVSDAVDKYTPGSAQTDGVEFIVHCNAFSSPTAYKPFLFWMDVLIEPGAGASGTVSPGLWVKNISVKDWVDYCGHNSCRVVRLGESAI